MTPRPLPPPALQRGARVGVAALSGIVDPVFLASGIETLESRGLEVVRAPNLDAQHGLFAGSDGDRVDGFHQLVADESIEAILFARGGHGLLRLLTRFDWDLLSRRPRWYAGFSDLTPLLAQVVTRLGWMSVHGPMVAADPPLAADETEDLIAVLEGRKHSEIALSGVDGDWRGVQAPLLGGCLSLVNATLGTEWAMPMAGTVLFLEDIHEPLYRVDRMLQQLKLAGALAEVRGVVLGSFEGTEGETATGELIDALREATDGVVPLAWGCPSGHCRPNHSLVLGALASVDPRELRLELKVT